MSETTKTILKNYFNTGDKPTEGQFEHLIDSTLNLIEEDQVVKVPINFASGSFTKLSFNLT